MVTRPVRKRRSWLLVVLLSIGVVHAWLYGPEAALIAERFGTRLRYTGASLGYQLASVTAGGPAPIFATYLLANHNSLARGYPAYTLIAAYIIVMSALSFIAVFFLKEYTGKVTAGDVA